MTSVIPHACGECFMNTLHVTSIEVTLASHAPDNGYIMEDKVQLPHFKLASFPITNHYLYKFPNQQIA